MDNEKNKKLHLKPAELALVVGTVIIFLASFFFIAHTFWTLSRNGSFTPLYHPRQQHIPRRQLQVNDIKSWMTFDYINRSFNLPSEYLKSKLDITDKKYPNITIGSWAKKSNQDPNKVIESIKSAVNEYLTPVTNTPVK